MNSQSRKFLGIITIKDIPIPSPVILHSSYFMCDFFPPANCLYSKCIYTLAIHPFNCFIPLILHWVPVFGEQSRNYSAEPTVSITNVCVMTFVSMLPSSSCHDNHHHQSRAACSDVMKVSLLCFNPVPLLFDRLTWLLGFSFLTNWCPKTALLI